MKLEEKESKLLIAFAKYKKLFEKLCSLYFQYKNCFNTMGQQIIRESILNEKISDEEKKEIENKIADLEIKIKSVKSEIENQIQIINSILEKEEPVIERACEKINRNHIDVMMQYNMCIVILKGLEKEYTDWDFSKVDFSKIDKAKMKLNIGIKKYNETKLKKVEYKLLDTFEAQKIAREEYLETTK